MPTPSFLSREQQDAEPGKFPKASSMVCDAMSDGDTEKALIFAPRTGQAPPI
jgi:hypothetical protein